MDSEFMVALAFAFALLILSISVYLKSPEGAKCESL